MATYHLTKQFPWQGPLSEKATRVCRMFGLTVDRLTSRAPAYRCHVEIRPGDIVYLTGPSGAGKSVLLRQLQQCVPATEVMDLAHLDLPQDRTVLDCFPGDVLANLRTLSAVGLNEVFAVLNRPCWLSEGQKYRFRLAQALMSGKPFVFADEFCSELDRITAANVAFNVHRLAKEQQKTLILASCRDDILMDLAPDVIIVKDFDDWAQVIYKERR
jgi:ABC-type ATPase with predicted acetyltransferase domain